MKWEKCTGIYLAIHLGNLRDENDKIIGSISISGANVLVKIKESPRFGVHAGQYKLNVADSFTEFLDTLPDPTLEIADDGTN